MAEQERRAGAGATAPDLADCEREPIHAPGAIQPYGFLLVIGDDPARTVLRASASVAGHTGVAAGVALGGPLDALLDGPSAAAVDAALRAPEPAAANPVPVVFRGPDGPRTGDALLHVEHGVAVCEVEPTDGTSAVAPGVLHAVSRSLAERGGAESVAERAAGEVRRLTGYERVMVYRFHDDAHGEVVVEAAAAGLDPFLGLHYPASDIPRQAREIFLRQPVRMIVDVDAEPSPLLALPGVDTDEPVDLGRSLLRTSSPIHLQYLRNMGVGASLTVSLVRDGKLWGLMTCHHPEPLRVPYAVRSACGLVAELLAYQLTAEEEAEREALRRARGELERSLVERIGAAGDVHRGFVGVGDAALSLLGADGLAGEVGGRRFAVGLVPDPAVDRVLVERVGDARSPLATDDLASVLPDGLDAGEVAGAVCLPLPEGLGSHLVWYRREWRHTVTWGGDPRKAASAAPPGTGTATPPGAAQGSFVPSIAPRTSFTPWTEEVRGRSRPWAPGEVDSAVTFRGALAERMLRAARDQLEHVALHDPLTGLPNRALLVRGLDERLAVGAREDERWIGVLSLDLDLFKGVNDSYGHVVGDELLRDVGTRLLEAAGPDEVVGRTGGDEFVVVGRAHAAPEGPEADAARFLDAVRRPFSVAGRTTRVTASAGVVVADLGSPRSSVALLRDADVALNEAKHAGRDRLARFDDELDRRRMRRLALEDRMRDAIAGGELSLAYQPLWRRDRTLSGFEALLRWETEGFGPVSPAEFIPVAEDTGMIVAIGDWVLRNAVQRLCELRADLPDDADELVMSVNLSPRELREDGLDERVSGALDSCGVPPDRLCLEVTESTLMGHDEPGAVALAALRERGVHVAIDDFGTGFSSLAALRRLPVDQLKIDRAFISGADGIETDTAIVASMLDMARHMGLETVAEGIETEEQLAAVQALGCDLAQGYLLGRPMPSDAVGSLVRR